MSAHNPDTIVPVPRTFEQKLRDDMDKQQMSALLRYLRQCTSELPYEKLEFKTKYGITDEQWTEESELKAVMNNFSYVSDHCREFEDKKVFGRFLENVTKIHNHSEEFNDDYEQVLKILKDWQDAKKERQDDACEKHKKEFEDWYRDEINFIETSEKEVKDVFEQIEDFSNYTRDDWEYKVKPSVMRIEEKYQKSKKNFPDSLLQDVQKLGKSINDAMIVIGYVMKDLKTLTVYMEKLKNMFFKMSDDRGPISIKKIYLEDVKNKWPDLGKLASECHNKIFIIIEQQEKEEAAVYNAMLSDE
ncbi:10029_t:CDS:2 [Acaulospora colombiana]|uniref:10029_t:CDS:1 n=1 Tax=Acaulospora colombiana TaxID=27376 RepID=A0ACA9K0J1_9GLOM|nr:10029_t:CDS:2 [Acaulospora colombiana]